MVSTATFSGITCKKVKSKLRFEITPNSEKTPYEYSVPTPNCGFMDQQLSLTGST